MAALLGQITICKIDDPAKKKAMRKQGIALYVIFITIMGMTVVTEVLRTQDISSWKTFKDVFRLGKGEVIKCQPDGEINRGYYYSLYANDVLITEMSQIDDLIAEIHYLNTGKKISESGIRFSFYSDKRKPLEVLIGEKRDNMSIAGMNIIRRNEIFIQGKTLSGVLAVIFHELGHTKDKHAKSEDEESFAAWNVMTSFAAMMYLDPALYVVYSDYMDNYSYRSMPLDKMPNDADAQELCMLKLANPSIEIKRSYSPGEVKKIIEQETKGRKHNELLSKAYDGMLTLIKDKFSDRKDFAGKYATIKAYVKYGMTDQMYDKPFIARDDIRKGISEKEDFLKQEHPEPIRYNLEESLLRDHAFLNDEEKYYQLLNQRVKRRTLPGLRPIDENAVRRLLYFSCKLNHKERALELYGMLKQFVEKYNIDSAKTATEFYEPYMADLSKQKENPPR